MLGAWFWLPRKASELNRHSLVKFCSNLKRFAFALHHPTHSAESKTKLYYNTLILSNYITFFFRRMYIGERNEWTKKIKKIKRKYIKRIRKKIKILIWKQKEKCEREGWRKSLTEEVEQKNSFLVVVRASNERGCLMNSAGHEGDQCRHTETANLRRIPRKNNQPSRMSFSWGSRLVYLPGPATVPCFTDVGVRVS